MPASETSNSTIISHRSTTPSQHLLRRRFLLGVRVLLLLRLPLALLSLLGLLLRARAAAKAEVIGLRRSKPGQTAGTIQARRLKL